MLVYKFTYMSYKKENFNIEISVYRKVKGLINECNNHYIVLRMFEIFIGHDFYKDVDNENILSENFFHLLVLWINMFHFYSLFVKIQIFDD